MALSVAQVKKFQDDGYLVIDTLIPHETLDTVANNFRDFWRGGEKLANVAYADFNRIQDAWKINGAVKSLATFPTILSALHDLYQCRPMPFQTLNFYKGTEQKIHSDSIHFNSEPFGLMCGVWVALEDIGPDQGPLVFYPGSHHLPEMNFEEMGLEADYKNYPKYEAYLDKLVKERGLQPEYGTIKKGQALIWAANLLHGGSRQKDKSLTRESQVTHYYLEGARPWRPGMSQTQRHYFEPEWIPYPRNRLAEALNIKRLLRRWF